MSSEDRKDNKWAKVLSDAGLLDEVDDAWEISDRNIREGATIEVHPSEESESEIRLPEQSHQDEPSVDEPAEEKVVIESTLSKKDDTTKKVVLSKSEPVAEEDITRGKKSRMPLQTVSETDIETGSSERDDTKKIETNPAPMARYSKGAEASEDGTQPKFVDSKVSEPPAGERIKLSEKKISVAPSPDTGLDGMSFGDIVDEPGAVSSDSIPAPELPDQRGEMARKYDLGDFSGALEMAEEVLELEPDSMDAIQYQKSCRERLMQMYESRIGDLKSVPRQKITNHDLMWRNLDASAGFVLSRVDGVGSYENILDISGMPRFDTFRILHRLLEDGLIEH